MTTAVDQPQVTVADLVAAVRSQRAGTVPLQTEPSPPEPVESLRAEPATGTRVGTGVGTGAGTVLVLGAHGGAGASTVALALADALADGLAETSGTPSADIRVIDLASPASSGLAPAAECVIASQYPGWRAARRRRATIYSPTSDHPSQLTLADVPEALTSGVGYTVIDLGRPWQPGTTDPSATLDRSSWATPCTVLVCRATVPGLRHAEGALEEIAKLPTELCGDVSLAAVGTRRWPSEVVASFGSHTAAAVAHRRCVLMPPDRRLARRGPEFARFSKPVAASARRLTALLSASPPPEGTR